MEIRYAGVAVLVTLFAGLFFLYVISRRASSVLLFALSGIAALSGGPAWLLLAAPSESAAAALIALGIAAGGVGGAILTGIDCLREEGWRREPAHPLQRPDDATVRELARRVRAGEAAVGNCPHCGRRVCFRTDLSCPGCGHTLDAAG